jgi:hypothetical protein
MKLSFYNAGSSNHFLRPELSAKRIRVKERNTGSKGKDRLSINYFEKGYNLSWSGRRLASYPCRGGLRSGIWNEYVKDINPGEKNLRWKVILPDHTVHNAAPHTQYLPYCNWSFRCEKTLLGNALFGQTSKYEQIIGFRTMCNEFLPLLRSWGGITSRGTCAKKKEQNWTMPD